MKINRAYLAVGLAALAISAYAILDTRRVTVESDNGKRVYRKVDFAGRVRLVKQLSEKPCTFGRTWGTDSNGIWVDDGCRAEFEYETGGRDVILKPGDILRPGYDTRRITVESDDNKRVYKRVDTSGGVRLVKKLSEKPCILNRSWGYDKNGVWVDDGCRAEFEVKSSKSGGGRDPGDWMPARGVPSWAVGKWRGFKNAASYTIEIRSNGTLTLEQRGGERTGEIRGDRVEIGDDLFRIEQQGPEQMRLMPVRTTRGLLNFMRVRR